jgi:hypothetical protein
MSLRLSRLPSSSAVSLLLAACTTPAVIADASGGTGGSHTTGSTGGGPSTGGSPGTGGHGTGGGLVCANACTTSGATRCVAGAIETCEDNPDDTACGLTWIPTAACPSGQACNSDGSECVPPAAMCTTNAECGCGCGCASAAGGGGMCHCTGAVPPTCNQASDCGPTCAGIACTNHQCVLPACTPGEDQTCNENPAMNAFAGQCTFARTCVCKMGFSLKPDGKCGP